MEDDESSLSDESDEDDDDQDYDFSSLQYNWFVLPWIISR